MEKQPEKVEQWISDTHTLLRAEVGLPGRVVCWVTDHHGGQEFGPFLLAELGTEPEHLYVRRSKHYSASQARAEAINALEGFLGLKSVNCLPDDWDERLHSWNFGFRVGVARRWKVAVPYAKVFEDLIFKSTTEGVITFFKVYQKETLVAVLGVTEAATTWHVRKGVTLSKAVCDLLFGEHKSLTGKTDAIEAVTVDGFEGFFTEDFLNQVFEGAERYVKHYPAPQVEEPVKVSYGLYKDEIRLMLEELDSIKQRVMSGETTALGFVEVQAGGTIRHAASYLGGTVDEACIIAGCEALKTYLVERMVGR